MIVIYIEIKLQFPYVPAQYEDYTAANAHLQYHKNKSSVSVALNVVKCWCYETPTSHKGESSDGECSDYDGSHCVMCN